MQDFRQLRVWRRAHAFAVDARRATSAFPRTGYSELKSQITRAADSIASNIVEGAGAATRKEFARFLDISIKSASEADYRLELAHDVGVLPYRVWRRLAREVGEIRKMLFALRRTILAAEQLAEDTRPEQADPEPAREGFDTQLEELGLTTDD
jgi:four helix bundle protein